MVAQRSVKAWVRGSSPWGGALIGMISLNTKVPILWEYRIAAIAGDCKSPGLTAFVGASPTAPTNLICV